MSALQQHAAPTCTERFTQHHGKYEYFTIAQSYCARISQFFFFFFFCPLPLLLCLSRVSVGVQIIPSPGGFVFVLRCG